MRKLGDFLKGILLMLLIAAGVYAIHIAANILRALATIAFAGDAAA